ncbi:MAG TPA: hypothetical protein VFB99_05920 [Vicinamibacterales bacterium]|nr:hypothetical protein [Vicinamibacterales bacterium]
MLPFRGATFRCAAPILQLQSVPQAELRHGVTHVIFDGVEADLASAGNLAIGHAVANGVDGLPLGWRQQVVVGWPATPSITDTSIQHDPMLAAGSAHFPPPFH